jgi:hypothetical protein
MEFVKKIRRRLLNQKELFILCLIAATFLSVLFLYSLKFDKNITGFMVIGDYFKAPKIWTNKTFVNKESVGYDGQFYYYIAHDPFILGQAFDHIDVPAYRYQRIIYPLTAWILSFGQSTLIPYMMVAVNFLGILSGTWVIILILKHFGRSPWYSLFYPASWGFLLSLLRSLPEPLALTFVVMSVFFYLKGKIFWQSLSLSLAALTQETTLLVSMAFFFAFLWEKDFRSSGYLLYPPLTFLLWQIYIHIRFHTFSYVGGTLNFGLPFLGILEKFGSLLHSRLSLETTSEFLFLILILFFIFTAFYQGIKYYSFLTLAFFIYALMTTLFNHLIWVEPWSYGRATLGLLAFNFLVFTKDGKKINLLPMFLIPVIFLLSLVSMRLL